MRINNLKTLIPILLIIVFIQNGCINITNNNKDSSKQELQLNGTYKLYEIKSSGNISDNYVSMHFTPFENNTFIVRGDSWVGKGTIDGSNGSYDWKFDDGKIGKTTIKINDDGTLDGHVNGDNGKINWLFKARK
jgi:hypothetical protein